MPGMQVSKTEFKAKALEYFRQVEQSGQHVIVTDHGKPTLEVRPFHGFDREPLEILSGTVVRYDNPTDPVDVDWEAGQ
ncbi:type II toxin-antitoxin system Phd/YefM family antitoxin [Cupriavidus sp. WKF15]|uniref:type II toxin-antitoxin system Phd/YefM family antitoxin n=1 Tax=Cupriavidus sp. WKF15 TaxID=3032282 RepID=UPI0023E2E106|nr:type II toxin-antitoxin system Phd/YefM family antitoxin [Cupriavidus sp. WKF15]WER48558.1 type II toxin-antitoxin system Phd/YefM family antitoxin [Cupriavidus sp. WKF15]